MRKKTRTTKKPMSPKKKKILIIAVLVIIIALIVAGLARGGSAPAFSIVGTEETVEKRDITSSITGSAVVMPKDQYSITSLVSGDVISADFEQGDVVVAASGVRAA